MEYVSNFFKTAVSSISPFKIEEYTLEQCVKEFNKCQKICDNGSFCLYKVANHYDMIYTCNFLAKKKAYSLFRLSSRDESEKLYTSLSSVLTDLENCDNSLIDKANLEKIAAQLRVHSNWNAAHVAAYLSFDECFKTQCFKHLINVADSESGQTPLHVAMTALNEGIVRQMLVLPNIDAELCDNRGNTVFHMAAAISNKNLIALFVPIARKCLNQLNKAGQSAVHIACENGSMECLDTLLCAGADPCLSEGEEYPIHVAVRIGSLELIKLLTNYNEKQMHFKTLNQGLSPLHVAKSKEVVECLCTLKFPLDMRDVNGMTPLATMVVAEELDVVLTLLVVGADPNIPDVNGNYPLHYAAQSSCIHILRAVIVFDGDVNVLNNKGESPRHMLAQRRHATKKTFASDMLYTLHAVGANRCQEGTIDCKPGCAFNDNNNGTHPSPIHETMEKRCNEDIVGAQMLKKTLKKDSSKISSSESPKVPTAPTADYSSILHRCPTSSDFLEDIPPRQDGYRVLSLDGGGIRGLLLVQTLIDIEKICKKPITEMFDWIGGTSTGGILALGLLTKKSLKECRAMYFYLKDIVFQGKRPYSAEPFEELLKKELGENTLMTDYTHPKVMITSLLGDRFPPVIHLFRNYDPPTEALLKQASPLFKISDHIADHTAIFGSLPAPREQLMWQAARATGAAPTYFRAHGRFLDGGLISNNPTLDLLTEISEYKTSLETASENPLIQKEIEKNIGVVISLGTGRIPVEEISQADVFRPNNPIDIFRTAVGITSLGKILLEMATMTEGRVVERARAWCCSLNVPFFRFSPPISADVPLDMTDNFILLQMLWEGKVYLNLNRDRLEKLVHIL